MSASEAMLPALWMMQYAIMLPALSGPRHERGRRERQALHTIGRRLPLEGIAEAHEIIERGEVIGHIVRDAS